MFQNFADKMKRAANPEVGLMDKTLIRDFSIEVDVPNSNKKIKKTTQ